MQKLSDSELSIMMKIWEAEKPVYLEEIVLALEEFDWVESTIRNFLTRIIDKGYLEVEKDGRKNVYIPLVSKDYINKEVKSIIENFYDSSIKNMLEELYKSELIDEEDIAELKKYLETKGENLNEKKDKEGKTNKKPVKRVKEKEEVKEKVVLKRLKNIL